MIIGLNGFKGSGKDTVGRYLTDRYHFRTASFAGLLKESAAALFGVEPVLWERLKNDPEARVRLSRTYSGDGFIDAEEVYSDISVREMLQRYGTEAHRQVFADDFWIRELFARLDAEAGFGGSGWGDVAFTDARFDNELSAIRAVGGVNFRIERGTGDGDGHASEALPRADLIDAIILNTGTFEQLYAEVDMYLAPVLAE